MFGLIYAFVFTEYKDMRIVSLFLFLILLSSCLLPAQSENNAVYTLPETPAVSEDVPQKTKTSDGFILAGTKKGLYKINQNKFLSQLWSEGSVSQIVRAEKILDNGRKAVQWYFLTTKGIVYSENLQNFEYRNEGLPFLTIKKYDGENTSFEKLPAQLKDLAVHPQNPDILVTATKDDVYITMDAGLSWKCLGSTSDSTSGIKAVAVASMNRPKTGKPAVKNADGTVTPAVAPEKDLVVFMAHTIFGFSYCYPEKSKIVWNDVSGGFEAMRTQTYPDEIADILPVVSTDADGNPVTSIYVSQSYLPRIYELNWNTKRAEKIYSGSEPVDTIDAMNWTDNRIVYSRPGEISAFNPSLKKSDFVPPEYEDWKSVFESIPNEDVLYSAWIPGLTPKDSGMTLGELWLLYPDTCNNAYSEKALDRKAVYVQAHKVMTKSGIDQYRAIIKNNKLDAMVIDMKDDYGGIRFDPIDPLIRKKGYISRYKIDLDTFVPQMKEDGIYLVARIVTFKDKNLSTYDKCQYAVWDKSLNKPWVGISGYAQTKDADGKVVSTKTTYYDENWVDPYSPEVWEYNVHIAKELIARGFDEIQFDYIRFPTDGRNMGNASFRWRSPGMDKESALVSFLRYARENIDAPIGIDIYGANGWYRSGTRTGQDVELLAEYVDVVCPMFYPSHFEQGFLNYEPYTERPYRVYYYGTYRNTVIGRNKLIIRPWVQAFYLNVSYDRNFYNKDYVIKEIYGVRDSVNRGYMYWNGMCRYDDISPDVGGSPYKGPSYEADSRFRKPALSGGKREVSVVVEKDEEALALEDMEGVALWDSVFFKTEKQKSSFSVFVDVKKLFQPYSES